MSKEKTKTYEQRFRKDWLRNELFCDWLAPVEGDEKSAYCKACKGVLKGKISCLINHRKTRKHIRCMAEYSLESIKVFSSNLNEIELKKLHSESMEDECCLSQLRLSNSEDNFDGGIEIQVNSKPDDSHNNASSPLSRKNRGFERRIISVPRKSYSDNSDQKVVYQKVVVPFYGDPLEQEVIAFGESITAQLRNLPEEKFVRLSVEIQNLVTQARMEHIQEQKSKENVQT